MSEVPKRPDPSSTSQHRLRQIALVAHDLSRVERLLTYVLGTEVVYVDPQVSQWGLNNFLVAIGGDMIEVVSSIKSDTTASRLLSKRGDGGYMIIMQTKDAAKQRARIESRGLAKVIYTHDQDDSLCVQYHPKGIKGGMMPELDSHQATQSNPTPLMTTFSPWHACGPLSSYPTYSAAMKRHSDLHLAGAVLRLSPHDSATEAASRQWEEIFGIPRSRDLLAFTNARLGFIRGEEGQPEGLVSITIAVEGKERFNGILQRASGAGLCGDGWINMCGVKWYFVEAGESRERSNL
ncbi:hypothetical protein EV356DRAFT_509686 [Viridothelium virens]|uniref:Glyoxalase-like domain-containing protein n=1 Tax=Viridothelium virens TaxID=1048519 RepID=A0A6A6HI36_VIRVR|nr:hypothetical protein EV356DRAFT_509686 [Viridothelium virens]